MTLWRDLVALVTRAFQEQPKELEAGADFASGQPTLPQYDPRVALSSLAGNPWVRACIEAIATDLSGLPLSLELRGAFVEEHPFLDVMNRPSSRVSGRQLRSQIVTDLWLTGNAFVLLIDEVGGVPRGLRRLHPGSVLIIPDGTGQAVAYEYRHGGTTNTYPASIVKHIRTPSWDDGPASLWGVGAIETLHKDLVADSELAKRSAISASQGRPAAIASPTADGALTKSQIEDFTNALTSTFRARDGGVAFLSRAIEIKPIAWSPADMMITEQRTLTREAIIAALGVAPTRVGIPSANYATAQTELEIYWGYILGRAALIDDALTEIARMWDITAIVQHDATGVPVLQASRESRLRRVETLVGLGVTVRDALDYEDFGDVPYTEPPPAPAPEPTAARALPGPVERAAPQDRAKAWRGWVQRAQGPAERALRGPALRYLSGARRRIMARLAAEVGRSGLLGVRRASVDEILEQVYPLEEEREIMRALFGDRLDREFAAAMRIAARQLGVSPGAVPETTATGLMVTRVTDSTKDIVRRVLAEQLDDGGSISAISAALQRSGGFSPERAQTIARTESTRAVNAGTNETISRANADEVIVDRTWLAASDARDEHLALDGVTVADGERFEIAGSSAEFPGDFGVAALDINCRCTIIPTVRG